MITPTTRLRRSLEKTLPFFAGIAGGTAPRFVYGGRVDVLPTFAYHAVGPSFEDDLVFLQRGGYRTAGADELAAYALGEAEPDGRTVCLTFDDGDESVVRVAAPLLERYGCRAIAFVVAGVVPDRTDGALAGWAELRAAAAAGALEVGSHSLYHHHVPVSADVVGFVDAETDTRFTANVPIPRVTGDDVPTIGTPVYRGRPRYTAAAAFLPDPNGLEGCRSFVRQAGEEVLRRPDGVRELLRLVPRRGTYESREEADAAIEADMRASFDRIAAECPNPAARQLCFPWYATNRRAEVLAGRAGASVLLGGARRGRRGRKDDRSPLVQRLLPDLLRRLPGPGRRSLRGILWQRVAAVTQRTLG
jgi:hypothetical protein